MADVTIEEGVLFGTGGGRDLLCDIYTPEVPNGVGVLVLYGGGWVRGDRSQMREHSLLLAGEGFTAVAGEYRLNGESPWPAQIHDVKAAIRWMRANSERLSIDPDKIALQGSSSGAHLSMLAAGTPGLPEFEGDGGNPGVSTEVNAVIGYYTPTLLFTGDDRPSGASPASALMLDQATEELAAAASPLTHVGPDYPPAFMLHGTVDKVVPVTATLRMNTALNAAGAASEIHIYPGLPHGFANHPGVIARSQSEVALFLQRHLVDPARFAEEAAPAEPATAGN